MSIDRPMATGPASDRLVYVYCLLRSARLPTPRKPRQPRAPKQSTRLIDAGDGFWMVVSDVPAAEFSEDALAARLQDLDWVSNWAVAHEAIVESFLGRADVVPLKLFTLFHSDARALAWLHGEKRRMRSLFRRIAGREEWSVRLTVSRTSETRGRPPAKRAASRGSAKGAPTSGIAYLRAKQHVQSAQRERLARAERLARRVDTRLGRFATARQAQPILTDSSSPSPLVLRAAYLVPVARVAAFRSAARELTRTIRGQGYRLVLSGPWPPYNFVGADERSAR
jgi:hypothetical protein